MTFRAPKVVNYSTQKIVNNPFAKELYEKPLSQAFKGKVNRKGIWWPQGEPAAGWGVSLLDVGIYKIEHRMNNINYSINIALENESGSIKVIDTTEMHFSVEIKDADGAPVNRDFVFSISFRT